MLKVTAGAWEKVVVGGWAYKCMEIAHKIFSTAPSVLKKFYIIYSKDLLLKPVSNLLHS